MTSKYSIGKYLSTCDLDPEIEKEYLELLNRPEDHLVRTAWEQVGDALQNAMDEFGRIENISIEQKKNK